jgi:hypothetical protein
MSRKVNDGDETGLKQDRFRHSRFEEKGGDFRGTQGVSRKTINTLGGPFDDNRGRRSAELNPRSQWDGSLFEDGSLSNWRNWQGWDEYYNHRRDQGNRSHGGALIGHDLGHRGRGPRGYSRSDESIYEDVCDMLTRSPDVDASEIEVSVKSGVVYLRGTVDDRQSKKMAEFEIENVSGVHDVQNLLDLEHNEKDLH